MADFITDRKQLIRVFTLNCWGIPFISKDRKSRITAIAEYLVSSNLDLVCLQEVWSKKDYLYISRECQAQLPYSHYFNSFINGSGLCILSKYPINDVYFHQWPINGYAHKIHQGDWFAGKGLAFSRIKINDLIIHLYNAHLHAEYNIHNAEYLSHRVLQAFDTSQFIKLTSEDCDLAILAGDLNTEPDDLAMKILSQNAHLMDSYYTAHEKSASIYGTNESTRNSYAPESELKRLPEGKRIDYILYRNSRRLKEGRSITSFMEAVLLRFAVLGTALILLSVLGWVLPFRSPEELWARSVLQPDKIPFQRRAGKIKEILMIIPIYRHVDALRYLFPLPERVPGCDHSYSDHEGIEVVLQCVIDSNLDAETPEVKPRDLQMTLETAIGICNEALNKLRFTQKTYLTFSVIFAALVFISLFAELFFYIPLDFGVNHVASIVCFNLIKVLVTLAFTFFTLMGTLWSKSEKSAVLTGKFSMMTILKRLQKT